MARMERGKLEPKEEYLKYFTEQDLIDRYTAKRKNMPREDVEDLYRAFYKYILSKLEDKSTPTMGFRMRLFGSFLHKRLRLDNLKLNVESPKYKRAEQQLHHYLSGHQRLKIENGS